MILVWSLDRARRFMQYLCNYSTHTSTEKRKSYNRTLYLYVGAGQTHTSEMDMPMVLPCWGVHTCMVSDAHGPQGKPKLGYLDYVHSCNLTAKWILSMLWSSDLKRTIEIHWMVPVSTLLCGALIFNWLRQLLRAAQKLWVLWICLLKFCVSTKTRLGTFFYERAGELRR